MQRYNRNRPIYSQIDQVTKWQLVKNLSIYT